ncbi:MAG TPA: DNA recombination protein RmuC, partial [Vicinamibacterales bacterium]|nr:DNA recombination protein RmuC [Vicinamibacterales bacterium]
QGRLTADTARLSTELAATERAAQEREARLAADLEAARRATEEQKALLASSQAQLREAFASLSKDALKENRTEFLQNADAVLKPVRETLDRVQRQLTEVDKNREGSFQAVKSQLEGLAQAQEQLRSAAEGLSRSLRSPNVRGKWGEIQLRRIVELAGMLEQCDFIEKESATDGDGQRLTPDLVVKLPGGTSIVIDSKVPIDAYLAAANATSEADRDARLADHARQVRDHVRALGGKEYWRQFEPSPEFVVMFLPLEPLLASAFEQDGSLLEQASALRVIPATPMTLLALLKAVAYGWQQQQLAQNAEEIRSIGRELYERLATMVDHLEGVGRNIKQAADSYDRFVGSLEQKVVPGARRFKELGVSSSKDVGLPEPLNLSIRRVEKPELTSASPDDRDDQAEPAMPLLSHDD